MATGRQRFWFRLLVLHNLSLFATAPAPTGELPDELPAPAHDAEQKLQGSGRLVSWDGSRRGM
jgi:hypothetical protein